MSLALVIFFLYFIGFCICNIEIVTENGWKDQEFRLTCQHLKSYIGIIEAQFSPEEEDSNTTQLLQTINYPVVYNIRLALNQRCSGRNHCSFILNVDYPAAKLWGPGRILIRYACMPEDRVSRFCNTMLTIPSGGGGNAQGFIATPGYPKFYVGQSECRWHIKAPENQRIQITLLDVSLNHNTNLFGSINRCEDDLIIFDEETVLIDTCQQEEVAPVVLSDSNEVDVVVIGRSGSLVAKRGVLLYYKALECPTLSAPTDGYLVYRNTTVAVYMCCVGFVFPDTLDRIRILKCLQNTWDQALPDDCLSFQNASFSTKLLTDNKLKMTDGAYVTDVVIPSILITLLMIGNAVIVFFIYRYKKRKHVDVITEEELNTIVPSSTNVP